MNVQISILGAIVIASNGTTIEREYIYYYVTLFTIINLSELILKNNILPEVNVGEEVGKVFDRGCG